jgi:hypothetical protein
MNVAVTLQTARCIAVAFAAGQSVTARIVFLDHIGVTLRTINVGQIIAVGQLVNPRVAIGAGKIPVDGFLEPGPVYEQRYRLTMDPFFRELLVRMAVQTVLIG